MEHSVLLDHVHAHFHRGEPLEYNSSATLASQFCGDQVTLYLNFRHEFGIEVWHSVQGCLVSQAAASYLCQLAERLHRQQLESLTEHEFLAELEPLTPLRRQCALLSLRCLQKALQEGI